MLPSLENSSSQIRQQGQTQQRFVSFEVWQLLLAEGVQPPQGSGSLSLQTARQYGWYDCLVIGNTLHYLLILSFRIPKRLTPEAYLSLDQKLSTEGYDTESYSVCLTFYI